MPAPFSILVLALAPLFGTVPADPLPAFGEGKPTQDEEPRSPRCIKCKNVGSRPCSKHKKSACALETNVRFCTEMDGCEECGGTGWIDCQRCESPEVEGDLATRRDRIPGIRKQLANFDKEMGRDLRKVQTDQFTLIWEVESMKVGKQRLDGHRLAHLYADRLEVLYADYKQLLGAEDGEFEKRLIVLVWGFDADHKEASLRFCKNSGVTGVKLLGAEPTYSTPASKRFFKDDESLHRNIVHNVTHLLLSHQRPSRWIGQSKGGWADAGLAHVFEDRYFGICDNYCYQEVASNRDFKGGKWRPVVRKMVSSGDCPSVAELFNQNVDTLTLPQHAVSFSLVDYLLFLDGAKLNLLLKRMRSRLPTRDALKECFGLKVIQLEKDWQAWVKDTYPLR